MLSCSLTLISELLLPVDKELGKLVLYYVMCLYILPIKYSVKREETKIEKERDSIL